MGVSPQSFCIAIRRQTHFKERMPFFNKVVFPNLRLIPSGTLLHLFVLSVLKRMYLNPSLILRMDLYSAIMKRER